MAQKVFALLILLLDAVWAYRYITHIRRGKKPTLATWLIFAVATSAGLTAYLMSPGERSIWNNAANTVDVLLTVGVSLFVLHRIGWKLAFEPEEKVAIALAIVTLAIWGITHNAVIAALLFNGVMTVAYYPMVRALYRARRNEDSPEAWAIGYCIAIVALAPPLLAEKTDWLALVYVFRALACGGVVLILMLRLHLRERREREQPLAQKAP